MQEDNAEFWLMRKKWNRLLIFGFILCLGSVFGFSIIYDQALPQSFGFASYFWPTLPACLVWFAIVAKHQSLKCPRCKRSFHGSSLLKELKNKISCRHCGLSEE